MVRKMTTMTLITNHPRWVFKDIMIGYLTRRFNFSEEYLIFKKYLADTVTKSKTVAVQNKVRLMVKLGALDETLLR